MVFLAAALVFLATHVDAAGPVGLALTGADYGRFPAQLPLDGRGQLSWDEVRPRVAARRRDVEVLLSEGPGAGMINLV